MNKKLFIVSILFFLAFAGKANAAGNIYGGYGAPCQPIYGGGETCISKGELLINKTVQNPTSKAFVDNLSLSNDPKYSINQEVIFRLTITNTGNSTLNEVEVNDILPSQLTYTAGPGTYNSSNRTLTFKIYDLKANESRTYDVAAKVTEFNSKEAVVCIVNQAKAKSNGNESSDLSQLCIERSVATTKGGQPVMGTPKGLTKTPATGPEMLALVGLIPAAGAGIFLRRKASK